jgi:hypothetical protein
MSSGGGAPEGLFFIHPQFSLYSLTENRQVMLFTVTHKKVTIINNQKNKYFSLMFQKRQSDEI